MSLAAALHAFVGYGVGQFMASFLIRVHDMGSGEAANWLAPISAMRFSTKNSTLDATARIRNDTMPWVIDNIGPRYIEPSATGIR